MGSLPPRLIGAIADEVAKTVVERLPHMIPRRRRGKQAKKIEKAVFLDTSAIIDGRIFDLLRLRLLQDTVVIPEEILLELKHIADSKDVVKRERGRKGLEMLEKLKKSKVVKVQTLPAGGNEKKSREAGSRFAGEVDERLIEVAKANRGRIITCDYNLEKKANIQGVTAINVNALANALKVIAVPGEALSVKLLHVGKDTSQGVGYLDDGTMIVVELAAPEVGTSIDVVVSRVIQTAAGRILFAKKI